MSPRIIIVTGTPGVGKTTLAKGLARETGFSYVGVNDLVRRERLHKGYDRKTDSYRIDMTRAKNRLTAITENERLVIDTNYVGGLIASKRDVIAIVLRLDPVALFERLSKRRWSRQKMLENVEAELVDVALIDAVKSLGKQRVFQINTTSKSASTVLRIALRILAGEKPRNLSSVNWLAKYDPVELLRDHR